MCLNLFSFSFDIKKLRKEITNKFSCRMEIKDGNVIKSFEEELLFYFFFHRYIGSEPNEKQI